MLRPLLLIVLALLTALTLLLWRQGAPWLFVAGMGLAAGAPLLRLSLGSRQIRRHPLMISVISGMGCVMIMIGSQRFGHEFEWALYPAASALLLWFLWQRWQRR